MKTEHKEAPTKCQVFKAVRLPHEVVMRILKIVEAEGSTFSQFMRTAAMEKLSGRDHTITQSKGI